MTTTEISPGTLVLVRTRPRKPSDAVPEELTHIGSFVRVERIGHSEFLHILIQGEIAILGERGIGHDYYMKGWKADQPKTQSISTSIIEEIEIL